MQITVALCTWNRAQLLDRTLTQMRSMCIPEGVEWELLVVNNNCTDDTDKVLDRHSTALPLRRLFEPKQGLSNARNCAVAKVRGELLIWTDDDVLVPCDWLIEYHQAATKYTESAFFGGPVRPWWEAPPPRWIQRHLKTLGGYWALLDWGEGTRILTPHEWVHGANMAFRVELIRHHRFDPSLGHVANCCRGGEDYKMQKELEAAGHSGLWIGTAPVQHFVPRGRMTTRYVWNYMQGDSHNSPRAKEDYSEFPTLLGHPRWLLKKYWIAHLKTLLRAPFRDDRWLKSFKEAAELLGVLRAWRERRIQASATGVSNHACV